VQDVCDRVLERLDRDRIEHVTQARHAQVEVSQHLQHAAVIAGLGRPRTAEVVWIALDEGEPVHERIGVERVLL